MKLFYSICHAISMPVSIITALGVWQLAVRLGVEHDFSIFLGAITFIGSLLGLLLIEHL